MLASIFPNTLGGERDVTKPVDPTPPPTPSPLPSETKTLADTPTKTRSMSMDSGLSVNLNFTVTMGGGNLPDPPTDEYVQKTKKTAGYLRLLLHSRKCHGNCMKTPCIRTSVVVDHINSCYDVRCAYPGCTTSKKLIEHYEKCGMSSVVHSSPRNRSPRQTNFCLLCSLVPQATTSPSNQLKYVTPEPGVYLAHGNSEEEIDRYGEIVYSEQKRRSLEEMEVRNSDSPVIFDEMMRFNRVPFQETPALCYPNSVVYGMAGATTYTDEPPRKIRSKSMNAMQNSNNELWNA